MRGKNISKAEGCIVGAAVGDALGMPTEGIPRSIFRAAYGEEVRKFEKPMKGEPCAHLNAGQYTDDTQQIILLAQSLISNRGLNLFDFGDRLANWAYRCKNETGYDRFSGRTSIYSAMRIKRGVSPYDSGTLNGTSCGSCMRVAPVGIFFKEFEGAEHAARLSSILTHKSEVAQDAAAAVALMVNLCVYSHMMPKEMAIKVMGKMRGNEMRLSISNAIENAQKEPDEVAKIIGTDSSAKSTAGFAIYCFLHNFGDFEQAIINAANVDNGDSDSIACITGAICGAYGGIGAIGQKFRIVEDYEKLILIADELAKFSQ